MDVATNDVPMNLESVEEKSDLEDQNGVEEYVDPPLKKPRFDKEVNKVAEIVLVLSALRKIRGGKSPTELEVELMVEAKSKLVEMCQEFAPKDIIGRDAIGAVIEDLGLNGKVKDQRLGFRAPKLTISEKLSLGKRKMEESKKQSVATTYTSPGHLNSTNNVSITHQWPNSELKTSTSSVNVTGSHFVREASGITQPSIQRPQFKSDMHTGASQGQVTAGNYFGNATSWSAQPHSSSSTISFGNAADNKVPVQSSSRVTDPSFRPVMSQTPPAAFPGMKSVNYGQTSSPFGNNQHAEIAKLIHKVLQPRAKTNLLWNPPSRDYMSKAMTCQMCQGTMNEVDIVLICDACEKGYHLKCLQAHNMKGVPKSEWHCSRCVQLYNGKSFPPKYGRVMRSATTPKMSFNTAEVQAPAEKKVGTMDQKAMPHSETEKPTEDKAMGQTVEAEDEAAMLRMVESEDAAIKQAVEANFETQVPIRNYDAKCDDPSEPVSHSKTLNPPKQEKKKVVANDLTDKSVSASGQNDTSKAIEESSLQAECSASQTEIPPSLPPSLQSNTDQSQQQNTVQNVQEAVQNTAPNVHEAVQNTTPNVQEAIQKTVTENPEEDKNC